ncbi:MAG: hypothetical protein ACK526_12825 [Planctomyces sp.]|jgi:hypothetical protein
MKPGSKRERVLLLALIATVLIPVFWGTFEQTFLQSINETQTSISAASRSQAELTAQAATVEHAVRQLRTLADSNLPSDQGNATATYQEWLIRQLQKSSISGAVVTPAPAIEEENAGYRIPFLVECSATSLQIASFIDQFHATPILHRMTSLNLTSGQPDDTTLRAAISIEALAMRSATDVTSLPEPAAVRSDESLSELMREKDPFQIRKPPAAVVVRKPEKRREETKPVKKEEPPVIAPDPRQFIRFVASVSRGSGRYAWFIDSRTRNEQSIVANDNLSPLELNGRMLKVESDYVLLELDGKPVRLDLGKTINDGIPQ